MRTFDDFLKSMTREERVMFETNNYLFSIPDYQKKIKFIRDEIDIQLPVLELIEELNKIKDHYEKYGLENVEIEIDSNYDNTMVYVVVETIETDSEYENRILKEEGKIKEKIKSIDDKYPNSLAEIKRLKEENEVLRRIAYKAEKEEFGRRVSGDAI